MTGSRTVNPRRTIALGPPYDDGKVPTPPPEPLTTDERLDRIERHLSLLDDRLEVILELRRDRLTEHTP